jgi:hypothetical protein
MRTDTKGDGQVFSLKIGVPEPGEGVAKYRIHGEVFPSVGIRFVAAAGWQTGKAQADGRN